MFKYLLRHTTLMVVVVMPFFLGSVSVSASTASDVDIIQQKLADLEKSSGGRLGVALINTKDNSYIVYRGGGAFPNVQYQ